MHDSCLESLVTYPSTAELLAHAAAEHGGDSDRDSDREYDASRAAQAQSEHLLLRVEYNTSSPADVRTVFIYSHGFPDASVATDALTAAEGAEGEAEDDATAGDSRLFASALPRKWGRGLLHSTSAAAFVCFNTRGVPGSGGAYFDKTLRADIDDIEMVRSYCAGAAGFPNATRLFLCGMSTGAFLSVAAAARPPPAVHPPMSPPLVTPTTTGASWPSLDLIARPTGEQQYAPASESGAGAEDEDSDEEQYRQLCAACGTMLCIDTCIMIYENPEWGIGERTYCSCCYWSHELYKDDTWPDNVDEIVEHLAHTLDDAQICAIAPVVAADRGLVSPIPAANPPPSAGVSRRWEGQLELCGVFVLACIDDIPGSGLPLDFSEEQRRQAEQQGWCDTNFWPWTPPGTALSMVVQEDAVPMLGLGLGLGLGPRRLEAEPGAPERWRLGRGYLDSYAHLPPTSTLRHSLRVPLLLIHGDKDAHVPMAHSERLRAALLRSSDAKETAVANDDSDSPEVRCGGSRVSLCVLKGGNHFLSSSKSVKQSLVAVRAFIKDASTT
jgi:pimeloyl-ACP methyl ester carboxylesterase